MRADAKPTAFSNKVLEDINSRYQRILEEKDSKAVQYAAAIDIFNKRNDFKNKMRSKFMSAQSNAKNPNDSTLLYAKSQYNAALSSCFNAETDSSIIGDSLRGCISYAAKMNNTAMIANSVLS